MLAKKSYPKAYVDARRKAVNSQITAFRKAAKIGDVSSIERHYFANLIFNLDASFVHRMRGQEGKDGNSINEVRLLTWSLTENNGVFGFPDKSIKWDSGKSVLGFDVGDKVVIDEAGFTNLADAYFDEIEARFV